MSPTLIPAPAATLFRIGRRPDPLAWVPWDRTGNGRFDDPARREFRVLYAGERRAAFLETLASLRPPVGRVSNPVLTRRWADERLLASFRIAAVFREDAWLDMRSPASLQFFRRQMHALLERHDLEDFDASTATSGIRPITRAVGQWAFNEGCNGIAYVSRFDPAVTCWALFERPGEAPFVDVDVQPLADDDPDFRYVVELFGLPPLPPISAR